MFGAIFYSHNYNGSLANQMVRIDNGLNSTGKDPMDQMLDTMREIAFRTSVVAGKDRNTSNVTDSHQRVEYHGSDFRTIYVTNFRYMAAAAIVSLLCLVVVTATFYD
jgi:hypothetical protein